MKKSLAPLFLIVYLLLTLPCFAATEGSSSGHAFISTEFATSTDIGFVLGGFGAVMALVAISLLFMRKRDQTET